MNYPISILLEKTAEDIYKNAITLGKERNLPGDLLATAFEKAYAKIQNERNLVLTDMVVEALNTMDKLKPATQEVTENKE